MYQNGQRVQGYNEERLHKNKMREHYAQQHYRGTESWNSLREKWEDKETPSHYCYHPLDYWKTFYLSGCRDYAKSETSSVLRAQNRKIAHAALYADDYDDIPMLRNGDYKRYYDYDWCIW